MMIRVAFTCALCEQPMHELTAAELAVQRETYAHLRRPESCRSVDHPHVRCERCSPPFFAACVRLKAKVEGLS
jgi:hypothetical protein